MIEKNKDKNKGCFSLLYLKCVSEASPSGKWVLLNQPASRDLKDEPIFMARTIEKIGAWLVVNGLYSSQTKIHLLSSPFTVTEQEVNTLFKNAHTFFHPLIKETVSFEQLLVYPEKRWCLSQ